MSTSVARAGVAYATTPLAVLTDPELTGDHAAVYALLDADLREGSVTTFTTVEALADALGVSEGHVTRLLRGLQAAGWIDRRSRGRRGWQTFLATAKGEPSPWAVDAGAVDPGLTAHHGAVNEQPELGLTAHYGAVKPVCTSLLEKEENKGPMELHEIDFDWTCAHWPRPEHLRNDARKEWGRARRRCGNALDFAASVKRWLDWWTANPQDAHYAYGLRTWLRNDLWREPPGPSSGSRETGTGSVSRATTEREWMDSLDDRPLMGFETDHPEGSPEFVEADRRYDAWLNRHP